MTLDEFLSTASADPVVALAEARAFEVSTGHLIPATTVNQLLAQLDLTGHIQDAASNFNHRARHKMAAVLLSIQGNHDFNFIVGTTAGDGNLAILDDIATLPEWVKPDELLQFKALVMGLANRATRPWAKLTLHELLLARQACPNKAIEATGGFAVIEASAACERHNPRLLGLNPITTRWQRIANFNGVEAAGKYEVTIPLANRGWALCVDNPYGVL